jgi:hypothetical protein
MLSCSCAYRRHVLAFRSRSRLGSAASRRTQSRRGSGAATGSCRQLRVAIVRRRSQYFQVFAVAAQSASEGAEKMIDAMVFARLRLDIAPARSVQERDEQVGFLPCSLIQRVELNGGPRHAIRAAVFS